jgi:hypothetical protein
MNPIALHPDNGHYFRFRGKPAVLVTSAEHYGAVLNGDFDFVPYLDELRARGFNLTRIFSGAYREVPGDFAITHNPLAPSPDRFVAPWPRSGTSGAADGGNRFDLARWNDDYFRRLHRFCAEAGKRGVVVEMVLFCPFYEESMWVVSPMNARNNVQNVGDVARTEVYTLKHAGLTAVQEALTRKIVRELRAFDNVYFEICNEPYFGGVTLDWQHRIADVIAETEADVPAAARHLIAQNIANGSARIEKPHRDVSVFNFHYAHPPDAVGVNYGLNRVIGFDETGFKGTGDAVYRTDGWEFLLAGGGVYNHLDYSFTTAHPKGTFAFPPTTPGGGGPALRAQLAVLKRFIERFEFVKMAPANGVVREGDAPAGTTVRVLAEEGRQYAVYVRGDGAARLALSVPAGRYRATWLHPRTGAEEKPQSVERTADAGDLRLAVPPYREDVALRLVRAPGGGR